MYLLVEDFVCSLSFCAGSHSRASCGGQGQLDAHLNPNHMFHMILMHRTNCLMCSSLETWSDFTVIHGTLTLLTS